MNAGALGKLLLTPLTFAAQAAQIGGKALSDIHAEDVPRLSAIGLQTISDIRVDLCAERSATQIADRRREVICGSRGG